MQTLYFSLIYKLNKNKDNLVYLTCKILIIKGVW